MAGVSARDPSLRSRPPLAGVANILRFNWHFFAAAGAAALVLAAASSWLGGPAGALLLAAAGLVLLTTFVSLAVSCYVYDLSGLYRLDWLAATGIEDRPGAAMANIHAGLDETTPLLRRRYPGASWKVMDFYDPARHTEVSIRRARRAHPPAPDDLAVDTAGLPVADGSLDAVFLILAAHEIRDRAERRAFFAELDRVLAPGGRIVVVEHLRDGRNFLAYTLGAFHFLGRRAWLDAFAGAGLRLAATFRPNFFLICFVLERHDPSS